jgi:hypothetical protein
VQSSRTRLFAALVTACNKCNARKSNGPLELFKQAVPARPVKGKYGEPEHRDGFSELFVIVAKDRSDLSSSEKRRLAALTA